MEEDTKKDEKVTDPAQINQEKIRELEKKCDEYLNNWKRERADFINYKKDELKRAELLIGYAKEDMIFKILPIIDSIELAKKHAPKEIQDNKWMEGFSQIQKQAEEFLKREGIEPIKTLGEPFDANTMEIVEEQTLEGKNPGEVIEELQKGYKLGDKLLRPARVKVSK